ncbi:unnamed protein product [Effrenium voratum]|nr:unnamed protein product [Effrenium voratum]
MSSAARPAEMGKEKEPQKKMQVLQMVLKGVLLFMLPQLLLMVVNGPVDGNGDETSGYWGPKTASVNWCERDYVVTHYIAEFANSLTSLIICAFGIYGMYAHQGAVELRYQVAFAFFVVVGLGSVAFHGTLLRSMQLLDELPMVWGNAIFIYICRTMHDEVGHVRYLECAILFLATLMATLAIIRFDSDNQNVFLVCYGSGVVYLVQQSHGFSALSSPNSSAQMLFTMAMIAYSSGFSLWLVDRNFCTSARWLYLHTFWHFGAGFGTFCAVLQWIMVRCQVLQRKSRLQGGLVTWWVEMPQK